MKDNPDLFAKEDKITGNNESTEESEVTASFERKPIRVTEKQVEITRQLVKKNGEVGYSMADEKFGLPKKYMKTFFESRKVIKLSKEEERLEEVRIKKEIKDLREGINKGDF